MFLNHSGFFKTKCSITGGEFSLLWTCGALYNILRGRIGFMFASFARNFVGLSQCLTCLHFEIMI